MAVGTSRGEGQLRMMDVLKREIMDVKLEHSECKLTVENPRRETWYV